MDDLIRWYCPSAGFCRTTRTMLFVNEKLGSYAKKEWDADQSRPLWPGRWDFLHLLRLRSKVLTKEILHIRAIAHKYFFIYLLLFLWYLVSKIMTWSLVQRFSDTCGLGFFIVIIICLSFQTSHARMSIKLECIKIFILIALIGHVRKICFRWM